MKFNKALVIGDLIIDKYVYGEVKRISPEAPVPVLNSNKFFTSLGGAGNVAKCISALNNQVDFVFNKGVASITSSTEAVHSIADFFPSKAVPNPKPTPIKSHSGSR